MYRLIFLLSFFSFNIFAQNQDYVDMGASAINVNGKSYLAIDFNNHKGWHTYWKNPGDAGLEIKLYFSHEQTPITLEELPWPTPTRYIEQGNMWAYGYSDQYTLFFQLPSDLKNKTLRIKGTWLVCKDICIPGTRTLDLKLNDNLEGSKNALNTKAQLTKAHAKLPSIKMDSNLNIFLTKGINENQLALHYILENVNPKLLRKKSNILTPYLTKPFDYKHEEVYFDKKTSTLFGRFYLDWDGIYEEPIWNLPKDGIFKKPISAQFLLNYPSDQNSKIISHTFSEFTLSGDEGLSQKFKSLQKIDESLKLTKHVEKKDDHSFFSYLLFAFLGGLILNLMPCVLPVISLKLFGLIVHRNENNSRIFKHNMAYTIGVLFSFLVLATIVTILKLSGEHIGWGFQLQSPTFVLVMILIIFVMALNMFGLYEFVTPGGKSLANKEVKEGFFGDFFNGILATILSTPCSAPFLGAALTFAFTTTILKSYIIFSTVAIGLAFPFILTGLFPKLIKFLPRPGHWMQKLKYFLGFTLLLTTVWLIEVFFTIIDYSETGLYFNILLASLFFTFFYRKFISKKPWPTLLLILLCFFFSYKTIHSFKKADLQNKNSYVQNGLNWKQWSIESMKESPGKVTFINFTAKWCLTCKVNKKLVLSSDGFKNLVTSNNIRLLEGDWTKRDDEITKFLKSYNLVGVPAYFIVKKDGTVISLGETISLNKILPHL